ncbi:MAG: YdcF family protein [Bryobacteraceae bacterium]
MKRTIAVVLLVVLIAAGAAYVLRIAAQIQQQSTVDDARPADVIIVLGAAEYRGRPSPVLEARLNHALWLYLKGMAPHIITTGGAGGDPMFTEGSVGRSYLTARGVPPEAILVEGEGETTVYSVAAVGEIMVRMNFTSAIVVSDGYHIFRVKRMLQSRGLKVYGSPRPSVPPGGWREQWLYLKQALGYVLWRVGISI